MIKMKINEIINLSKILTPIEKYKGILLKRDDKFILQEVNGGKVRQAIYLINNNYNLIKNKYKGNIICACSIKSPQSAIISTIAKQFGFKSKIVTFKTIKPNINLSIAQKEDAEIYGVNSGYTSVINCYAKKLFGFITNMGFESKDILQANINQVKNIPINLDYLVIPVGSSMNFISIIKGLELYNKKPKNIIGIYVGKNPIPTINKYLKTNLNYKIIQYPKSYGTEINIDNYFFDPIYEAKVYDWIIKNLPLNKKILFWIVGKRNLKIQPEKINFKEINLETNQKLVF